MNNDAEKRVMLSLQRRRLLRWRIGAVCSFIVALFVCVMPSSLRHPSHAKPPHIARIVFDGVIGDDVSVQEKAIYHAAKDASVTGLLVVVNSPGGAVTGGERLHDAIAQFSAEKPVVVSMGALGASAAYMLSVPAQHIVAMPSTLTGSIGVIMEHYDVSPLLGRLGVSSAPIMSGAMKDQGDMTVPISPEGHDMLQGLVHDLFDQFVMMVAQGRHMDPAKVRALADGRAYTGHQAIALGLVDELGNEHVARVWLRHRLGITADQYPVSEIGVRRDKRSFLGIPYKTIMGGLFGEAVMRHFDMVSARDALDGPVAILSW
ncbi:signal peptide peptidase SppA [Neokomagataea thailandica]|uniref:Signal peptide peptidase sppA n=1 Tax=Neokomagataea tanensis NBRC 106556 TaxID=1223519 RepID=A0ABQ0QKM5_9PROT|nr:MULTISPECIES: signal peptide peptidase SppA [Neokomagataea]GBR48193.1 signal peptide peptidase sppA [Neokomagataea tanensis NBRC 106556]